VTQESSFGGASKVGTSLLSKPEKMLVSKFVDRIPKSLETYHLTMLTLLWSVLILLFSALANGNIHWLWLVSLMVVFQYITDLFDGAVGRRRNTGLVKWGFYMDHFLDYVFLACLITGYSIISPPGLEFYFMMILLATGGFMVNSFLSFAATNQFEIYFFGIGPTEIRIVFIIINTSIIYLGTKYFYQGVPIYTVIVIISLAYMVFRSHKVLWAIDMKNKRDAE